VLLGLAPTVREPEADGVIEAGNVPEPVAEVDAVWLPVGVPVGLLVLDTVAVGETEGLLGVVEEAEGEAPTLNETAGEGDADGSAVGENVTLAVAVGVGLPVTDAVGDGLSAGAGASLGVEPGDSVAEPDTDGAPDNEADGDGVADGVRLPLGEPEGVPWWRPGVQRVRQRARRPWTAWLTRIR
jgi:hypothetical protein